MVGLCGISFKSFHLVSSKFFLFIVPRSVMEIAMLRNLWCIYFPPNALNNIKEIKIFVRFQVYLLLHKRKKKLFTFLSNFKDIYVCVEKKIYNL